MLGSGWARAARFCESPRRSRGCGTKNNRADAGGGTQARRRRRGSDRPARLESHVFYGTMTRHVVRRAHMPANPAIRRRADRWRAHLPVGAPATRSSIGWAGLLKLSRLNAPGATPLAGPRTRGIDLGTWQRCPDDGLGGGAGGGTETDVAPAHRVDPPAGPGPGP